MKNIINITLLTGYLQISTFLLVGTAFSNQDTNITGKLTDEERSKVHNILIPEKSIKGTSRYSPEILIIKVGEQVNWINNDGRNHFVNYIPVFQMFSSYDNDDDDDNDDSKTSSNKDIMKFNSPPIKKKGGSWVLKFSKAGTYSYYCFTHPLEMKGKIIVE